AVGPTRASPSPCRYSAIVSAARASEEPSAVVGATGSRDIVGRLGGEQLLEASRVVERADEREVEPLVLEEVLRDALDVLDGDLVEPREQLVGILDLAFEHLAPEAVLDRPLRALESEDEPALRVAACLLELVGWDRLGCDLPHLAENGRDRLVHALDVATRPRAEHPRVM